MARTVITPTTIDVDGVAQPSVTTGIADGHKFLNSGEDVFVEVTQSSGGALSITFPTPATTADGLDIEDMTISCTSGQTYNVGPFRNSMFLQSDGYVWINYESASESEFSVRVYRLPRVQ